MKSFWAIVKLTYRNAMRSHIFQLLLFVLLLCVALVPTTVRGSVSAGDFFQISLLYSLSAVSTVLALSSIWIGCFVMTQDVDSYQLHMVVTKPVSRIKIWLAKWTGVTLIHLVLLVFAAAATYGLILWNYSTQEFSPEERAKVRNEIMVGRRVYLPEKPDYDAIARDAVKRRLEALRAAGQEVDMSPRSQEEMLREAKREVVSQLSALAPGKGRAWKFKNLPEKLDKPMYLRFRPYVGKIASEGQRMTRGIWEAGVAKINDGTAEGNVFQSGLPAGYEIYFFPLSQYPEQLMSGVFHEKTLLPDWKLITPDNEVLIRYTNFDESDGTQHFQVADGPKLLVEVTGFGANYTRAVLVIAIELVILAGLGCAFGGFMSMPTAIFVVLSYLLFGSLGTYMLSQTYVSGIGDVIARMLAGGLLKVVIPLQVFDATGLVSSGELVEYGLIWQLFYQYFVFRALPLFALGAFLYNRRELGLIIRK